MVLVTGATGFIGGAVALQLLEQPPGPLVFLVRAASASEARQRLRASVARFVAPAVPSSGAAAPAPPALPTAVEAALADARVFAADLTDAGSLTDPSLDAVTHALHLAANTSFRSVRGVRRCNIDGTLTLVERLLRAPRLARFLYVSTAYLCGANPPAVVHESAFPQAHSAHLVEYTRSKAETEFLLHDRFPALPLVIARPSVVVGHTRLGTLPSASIFWYYRTLDLLRRSCAPMHTRKDIVPVDYVADTLLTLLFKPALRHRCYHISAGESSCVTWQEMAEGFAGVHGPRPGDPYQVVDFSTLRKERHRMRARLGAGDEERLLQALEMYVRFSTCGAELFANERLLAEGVPPAPRFTSYLPLCATLSAGSSVYTQMDADG
jgi:nucleoside-diphosphate-sugar epimerase